MWHTKDRKKNLATAVPKKTEFAAMQSTMDPHFQHVFTMAFVIGLATFKGPAFHHGIHTGVGAGHIGAHDVHASFTEAQRQQGSQPQSGKKIPLGAKKSHNSWLFWTFLLENEGIF